MSAPRRSSNEAAVVSGGLLNEERRSATAVVTVGNKVVIFLCDTLCASSGEEGARDEGVCKGRVAMGRLPKKSGVVRLPLLNKLSWSSTLLQAKAMEKRNTNKRKHVLTRRTEKYGLKLRIVGDRWVVMTNKQPNFI